MILQHNTVSSYKSTICAVVWQKFVGKMGEIMAKSDKIHAYLSAAEAVIRSWFSENDNYTFFSCYLPLDICHRLAAGLVISRFSFDFRLIPAGWPPGSWLPRLPWWPPSSLCQHFLAATPHPLVRAPAGGAVPWSPFKRKI